MKAFLLLLVSAVSAAAPALSVDVALERHAISQDIYGMNFANIPELHWDYGYLYALALMAAVDGLLFVRFRRVKWI